MTTQTTTAPENNSDTHVTDTSVAASSCGTSVLDRVLHPLSGWYGKLDVVELRMVRPCEVIVDRRGVGLERIDAPDLRLGDIVTICRTIANISGLEFDADQSPVLSAVLPGTHRFECLVGGSVSSGLSLAIRCKHPFKVTLEQIGLVGSVMEAVQAAVHDQANIIVSGATNTGKTTFLNRLLAWLPDDRRVVAVEDTPELEIGRFWNGTGLLAARGGKVEGMLDWRGLYDHSMRITPDSLVFGEISTGNAFAALAALNSGIRGFMCTIHAESPEQVVNRKFDQNIAFAGERMPEVSSFLRELVDLIVQIKRDTDGMRRVTDIWLPKEDRYVLRHGVAQ